jgi:hypothetical protein
LLPQISGTPPLHVRVPGWQALHCPAPSHRAAPPPQTVLAGFGAELQVPPLHVGAKHSPGAAHWEANVHWTQAWVAGSQ